AARNQSFGPRGGGRRHLRVAARARTTPTGEGGGEGTMERRWRALGMAAGLLSTGVRAERVQVELLEEDKARVIDLDSGKARTVDRAAMPKGVQEANIVVDGRVDAELTARLRQQVHELHERLAVPVPAGLNLDSDEAPPLTATGERGRCAQ